MNFKEKIRTVPHWPIEGVMFRDITTLLQDPEAFRATCDEFYERYKDMKIDKVVGIDARGFIFGAVLAYRLNVGFVPVRKKGKLPPETISEEYTLEYGSAVVEMSENAIQTERTS
jgi:adenine phosphoribosyltransferase